MIFKKLVKAFTISAALLFGSLSFAQQVMPQTPPAPPAYEVSENDLSKFVTAYTLMQAISQQTQREMVQTVESMGMSMERYSEIQRAKQDVTAENTASAEEKALLSKIDTKLLEMQQTAQEEMAREIEASGITMERYQEIGMAIQADPALMEKVQEMIQQG